MQIKPKLKPGNKHLNLSLPESIIALIDEHVTTPKKERGRGRVVAELVLEKFGKPAQPQ